MLTRTGIIQVVITSFGYLHCEHTPTADITVDVRAHLRDPHTDPEFRSLTGHDRAVWDKVINTPGATDLISGLSSAVLALRPGADAAGRLITVAIGCAGGRHRSVVLAEALGYRLTSEGVGVETEHMHINEEVVTSP